MYSDYNLQQLLELALRVPEIGAVNFNILYAVLKTIIQKQGLEAVKPSFSCDVPFTVHPSGVKDHSKRSHSEESVVRTTYGAVQDSTKSKIEDIEFPGHGVEANKWLNMKYLKRLDAVEDEISELHILIAQLGDKSANIDRVTGLQGSKFASQLNELQTKIIPEERIDSIDNEIRNISAQLSELAERYEKEKLAKRYGEEKHLKTLGLEEHKHFKIDKHDKEINKMKNLMEELSSNLTSMKEHLKEIDQELLDLTDLKTRQEDEEEITSSTEEKKPHMPKKQVSEIQVPGKQDSQVQVSVQQYDQIQLDKDDEIDLPVKQGDEIQGQEDIVKTPKKQGDKIKLLRKSPKKQEDKIPRKQEDRVQVPKKERGRALQSKMDLEAMTMGIDVQNLKEKNAALDSELAKTNMEIVKTNMEIEFLKVNADNLEQKYQELLDGFDDIKKEMVMSNAVQLLSRRIEKMENYMLSEEQHVEKFDPLSLTQRPVRDKKKKGLDIVSGSYQEPEMHLDFGAVAAETSSAKRVAKTVKSAEAKIDEVSVVKPEMRKPKKKRTKDIEELLDVDDVPSVEEGLYYDPIKAKIKFQAAALDIALVKGAEKKKEKAKYERVEAPKEEYEDFEEPLYEEIYPEEEAPDAGEEFTNVPLPRKTPKKYAQPIFKGTTVMSADILEEHSRQLKGQVIIFVNKRIEAFRSNLQIMESELVTVKKKTEQFEKQIREVFEKIAFADSNFNRRTEDLIALKKMVQNHQISVVNIMHELDRKAESYIVNQKVSKNELTVIEDRVIKLCMTTSSEISALEERLEDSFDKVHIELDRKLYSEEFVIRQEPLMNKVQRLEKKFKELTSENSVIEFNNIRPVEIKKYVLTKDGRKIPQDWKKPATWKPTFVPESVIPVLSAHQQTNEKGSTKVGMQVQRELENAVIRESRRYVDGAHTKISVGRN